MLDLALACAGSFSVLLLRLEVAIDSSYTTCRVLLQLQMIPFWMLIKWRTSSNFAQPKRRWSFSRFLVHKFYPTFHSCFSTHFFHFLYRCASFFWLQNYNGDKDNLGKCEQVNLSLHVYFGLYIIILCDKIKSLIDEQIQLLKIVAHIFTVIIMRYIFVSMYLILLLVWCDNIVFQT